MPLRSHVASLFLSSCPSTVSGLVMPVRIDAVYRHGRGRLGAHVLEKADKGSPAGTDADAPAAVVLPTWMRWICATTTHALPALILWRSGAPAILATSMAVNGLAQTDPLDSQTVAARGAARQKILNIDNADSAAIAAAYPARFFLGGPLRVKSNNCPSSKLFSGAVYNLASHSN